LLSEVGTRAVSVDTDDGWKDEVFSEDAGTDCRTGPMQRDALWDTETEVDADEELDADATWDVEDAKVECACGEDTCNSRSVEECEFGCDPVRRVQVMAEEHGW